MTAATSLRARVARLEQRIEAAAANSRAAIVREARAAVEALNALAPEQRAAILAERERQWSAEDAALAALPRPEGEGFGAELQRARWRLARGRVEHRQPDAA